MMLKRVVFGPGAVSVLALLDSLRDSVLLLHLLEEQEVCGTPDHIPELKTFEMPIGEDSIHHLALNLRNRSRNHSNETQAQDLAEVSIILLSDFSLLSNYLN
jgi:hypothetical protein